MASTLSEIRKNRIEKLEKLKKLGIDPYPARAERTNKNKDITDKFDELKEKEVSVVGRIMAKRGHGAVSFIDLRDESGKIQLYLKEENLKKASKGILKYSQFHLLDIGDFIEATGKVTKTERGEISVEPTKIKVLTKTLRPLPEKYKKIKNTELRLRRRYLDMTMNPETRELFVKKSMFWHHMREFLETKGFLEIRTPVLEYTTGGADAKPFETHYNALNEDLYLRISLELFLKRAIGGGFEKVFEIGPVFRNEGISTEHLQDYDMVEFYWAYHDYKQGMDLVEEMYKYVAEKTFGKLKFKIKKFEVDLGKEWEEIDYVHTIKKKYKIDVLKATQPELKKRLDSVGIEYEKGSVTKPRLVDVLWKSIRKEIAGPVFLVNQPKFVSPLAKSKPEEPKLTERYQVIIAGSEIGNGYSELNDPQDQLKRFEEQEELRKSGDEEAQMLDDDFVRMLEYGMPPTTGFGVSERLFAYLANEPIRQTVIFPQLGKEKPDRILNKK